MNLLQKQGFFNSIILYIGFAVGFLNSMILFQRFLTLEEIGFFYLLINISVFYTQLTSLGLPAVITRYFPFYRTQDKTHYGFPVFVIKLCLLSFVVVSAGFIALKEIAFSMNSGKAGASLMSRYSVYIIPVSFFTLAFLIQESFAKANYKNVFPAFLREVLLRVFTSLGVIFIALEWFDYSGFIQFYLAANLFILLVIGYYNYKLQTFRISPVTHEVAKEARPMLHYGLLSMLGGSALVLIASISPFVLKIVNGEAVVGIYGTFFVIAQVISFPAKALNTTSYQIISDAWKNEDLQKINRIYFKTSVMQLLIGCLLLIGLIINQKNILYILHKPEFGDHFMVFILIGLGFLIDITGGLNGAIIGFSQKYKTQTRILIAVVILSLLLSIAFISNFGLIGAAASYALTMLILNFNYWLYLKLRFGLQPFGRKHLLVLLIGGISLIVGVYIPHLSNYYFDVIVRSGVVTILYLVAVYWLNISEDINDLVDKVLMRK